MRLRLVTTLALVALTCAAAGCGNEGSRPASAPVGQSESSWIPGQPALSSLPDYAGLLSRAGAAGDKRAAERAAELRRIEAEKRAARLRARREALRKYLEAKRRAELLRREALRMTAHARELQRERLRQAQIERARRLRELLKKLRVEPGEECGLPDVEEQFECRAGRLPLKGAPSKR